MKNGHEYVFEAPSGVYGKRRIDKASELLIENVEVKGDKLLDIGCGYGVIGITLKKENPNLTVFMSDINKRAVNYSKKNAKNNNAQITIKEGNLFEPWQEEIFTTIVSNPPIVAGKNIWQEIIENAYNHLENKGVLFLVAYHNKGGSAIKEYMEDKFSNVKDVIKSGGIRVYKSVKDVQNVL
jgi:16S rRNA G1207 methylase RsmC